MQIQTLFRSLGFALLAAASCAHAQPASAPRSRCETTALFVYVPSDAMLQSAGKTREQWISETLKKNGEPADAQLAACGKTREQWRASIGRR